MEKNESGKPVVLVVGMAGSGKTTFLQRLQADLELTHDQSPYLINLDPAVLDTPYQAHLDIRDTIDYKKVMSDYKLGPNGAILTALNLYATKWDQVLQLIGERQEELDCVLIDTPGQIEIFTWSASGAIISRTLSSTYPTCLAYIIDVQRCSESPIAFMSNMLYACSIMYKLQLPFILVLNKTDLSDPEPIMRWLSDYDAFQEALGKYKPESYSTYMMQSLALVLEEFYCNIRTIAVSSFTGDGMDEFMELVNTVIADHVKDEISEEMNNKLNLN